MAQFVDPNHLRKVLIEYYNAGELRTLCFELSIDYENLGGRGKAEKVAELVLYARRNNRLNEIANYVRQTRPFVQLKMNDTPPPLLAEAEGSARTVTHVTHVHGDMVGGDKIDGDKVGGDTIKVGNISGSSGVAIGRDASAKVKTEPTYNISGPVVGSTIGGGTINAENIAAGDININADPKSKDEFNEQLQALKALLEQAVASGELKGDDGETAVSDLQDVLDEIDKATPRAGRIKRRLQDITEVVGAAAKAGTAVIKATPIIAALIKAVGLVF